jgi:inhibitor of the pro-sigma K processing machinery
LNYYFDKGGFELPQIDVFSILAIFLAIGAVYIIGVLLVLPIKIIVKLVINGIIGAIALFIINIFGGLVGITIGINPITALIAGFLGIPGIILLLFLQYLL